LTSFHIFGLPECNDKFRPAPFTRIYPGMAAMPGGNLLHYRKPRACSFDISPHCSLEELKDTLCVLGRYSGTAVANGDTDHIPRRTIWLIGSYFDVRRFTVASKFKRICD
jgi:hypothetical protein